MGLARQVLLWASRNEWLGQQFQKRSFTRRAASRFIPGEDLEDALAAARSFQPQRIGNLLTLLGENVSSAADAEHITTQYVAAAEQISDLDLDCQLSVKPTQLGLDAGDEVCLKQLGRLAETAVQQDSLVWVDMESSEYVDRTLDIVAQANEAHRNVGVCIQAYLHRTARDLETLIASKTPVRLVKGAYREPAYLAIQRKVDVDDNYFALAARILDATSSNEGGFAGFGTHDMNLISRIQEEATDKGVERDSFEFEMLYGIGKDHQLALAADRYRVRVLISYGTAWFPWYMRRLAERPANVGFVLRSLISG